MTALLFEVYGDNVPLGLQIDPFVDYALSQFQNNRLNQIERARHQSMAELVSRLPLGEG